jgi:hypothetical protein
MAEQTFKSPGFFDTEIVTERRQNLEQIITTVPAGVVGFSEKGPAFTPITVNSYERFVEVFGEAKAEYPSTLAVKKYLEHRDALTFVRVLGAGANTTVSHFTTTERLGTVENSGFILTSSGETSNNKNVYGAVQFLCAEHEVSAVETVGYPVFVSNNTTLSNNPYIVRGVLFTTTGSKFVTINHSASFNPGTDPDFNGSTVSSTISDAMYNKFKLILTSSDSSLGTVDGFSGAKVFSASLNPQSDAYIGKVLNTDPARFQNDKHLLYAHFPIENEIAPVDKSPTKNVSIGLMSGSADSSAVSGKRFNHIFGNFQTRYESPKTTKFISQPFGDVEYDLFHFECIDDGRYANNLYKISIANIKKSDNPEDPYPTFDVELRNKRDTDTSLQVIERFVNCDLNPDSPNFIANKIGDMKMVYNFDATDAKEKRLVIQGTYPNNSARIRVILSDALVEGQVPKESAPFGFRGLPLLKTFNEEPDTANLDQGLGENGRFERIVYLDGAAVATSDAMTGSILPPVPFRYKVTIGEARGNVQGDFNYVGEGAVGESAVKGMSWGVKFERLPADGEIADPVNRSNESIVYNEMIDNMSKFLGIQKLDALVTGSGADSFNHNKFTLSRVGLGKFLETGETLSNYSQLLTGSAETEMKNAAYIRDSEVNKSDYTITDDIKTGRQRLTLGSLMSLTASAYFNRFSEYTKFTNMFYGGFDGTNILDPDQAIMNDKASSSDSGGKGVDSPDIGLNMSFGTGDSNAYVNSYKVAVNLLTDPAQSRINILTFPGIRSDELISHAIEKIEEYGKGLLLLDVPHITSKDERMYEDTAGTVNVRKTVENFSDKNYDTSYAAAYFPDVIIDDEGRRKLVPATVAALSAIGYNDNTSFPWFAPAGFNRGSLGFVTSARARLNKSDRDVAYEARVNPISTFPKSGYVISGQKTLQRARTSLDRVNVRRMLLEVKRIVSEISIGFVFEANTPEVRSLFKGRVDSALASVQENQGIDQFKVIIDSTNNTQSDIDNNVLNGRIVIVPTRAIEFVAIDFVISNSGIDFV